MPGLELDGDTELGSLGIEGIELGVVDRRVEPERVDVAADEPVLGDGQLSSSSRTPFMPENGSMPYIPDTRSGKRSTTLATDSKGTRTSSRSR